MMELVFLGTSSARPTQKRGLSCTCLNTETEILIFDVGEGATDHAFIFTARFFAICTDVLPARTVIFATTVCRLGLS